MERLNQTILNEFRLTVAEKHLGVYGVRVETGEGESVSHRWRSNDRENLYSGSKTFTSMAVGMCIDDGKLSLDDHALRFFPEFEAVASPGSEAITVRDLLHMASGKLVDSFESYSIEEQMTTDWAELFFRLPQEREPGTTFFYSNPCTYMLGRIVEKLSGQKVRDFLVPRLFTPLGIHNPQWRMCPQGHTFSASGLYLTTEEYSRIGMLLLGGGEYAGKRLVSREYLAKATTDLIDNKAFNAFGSGEPESMGGYGYQLWPCTREGTYRADGMYGQFCIVMPDLNAVATVTGHEEHRTYDIIRAVFGDIAPHLHQSH